MLSVLFRQVLESYAQAKAEPFAKHPFREVLWEQLPSAIREHVDGGDRYLVKGSPGQTHWTHCPWVAVLDQIITDSPQRGYYPVYLFQANLAGFYLSLNQGITDLKEEYKARTREVLQVRAADFLAKVGSIPEGFESGTIELHAPKGTDPSFYDFGNILGKYYSLKALPSDEVLIQDLREILSVYSELVEADSSEVVLRDEAPAGLSAEQSAPEVFFEDGRRKRLHSRIERNSKLIAAVKKHHGTLCQVCKFDFKKAYGELGAGYIEAHHLTPLAKLRERVSRDPAKDFAVLCANCHRMAHRLVDSSNLALLQATFERFIHRQ